MKRTLTALALAFALVVSAAAHAADPVDFTLETSSGSSEALAAYRGKVVVVFYEDRHHTETNAKVKEAVARYGLENKLQDKVVVLAVANLKGYDFAPASTIARQAIRAIASRFGISIWLDWKGIVIDKLGVQDSNANVVVVDKNGAPAWKKSGRLGDAEQRDLLTAVSAAL